MRSGLTNIRQLHIVRGLAALLVVFFHAKYVYWVGGAVYTAEVGLHSFTDYFIFSLDMLSSCGKECVIIFFILSAFVIKHSVLQHHYSWSNFYRIRALRIYLPFLFSLVFSVAVLFICTRLINPNIYTDSLRSYNTRLFTAVNEFSFSQVARTFFFIENGEFAGANYAYWSLGHELIFYAMFPLYILLKRNMTIAVAVIFLAVYLFTGFKIFYYQLFFLGGLLMYDYFKIPGRKPLLTNKLIYRIILLLFFIAVNFSNRVLSAYFSETLTFIYSFFIFDYVLFFVNKRNNILMKLGDISYTLYLNHLPVLLFGYSLITLFTNQLVFYNRVPYYLGVIFAVTVSVPLYLLAEKPSIKYLKKFRTRT